MGPEPFRLYMREVAYSAYSEAVANAGPFQAWYREYREPAAIEKGYSELDWVLTEKSLLRIQIAPNSIEINTFSRDAVVRVIRYYIIVQKQDHYENVLNRVVVKFSNGEACELMRPLDEIIDKEKTGGFNNLIGLLG